MERFRCSLDATSSLLCGNVDEQKSMVLINENFEIPLELFWAGLFVFIIGSIFSGFLGLFVLLGYVNLETIGYLFNAGVNLFLLGDSLILLGVFLIKCVQSGS